MTVRRPPDPRPVASISFPIWLTLLFLFLRCVGVLTWPWLWVFSPVWVTTGLVLVWAIIVSLVPEDDL